MSYKAILFDLDNTLLDFTASETVSLHAVHQQFFKEHVVIDDFKQHYQEINKGLWKLVESGSCTTEQIKIERFKRLTEKLQINIDYSAIADIYEESLGDSADWYPQAKETLFLLKQKFELGIITNGLTSVQEKKYYRLGFDQLCACCLISESVGIAKPNKAIFELALNELGLNAHEALMVGDSLSSDYAGALNANIDFCWINLHNSPLPTNLPEPKYIVKNVLQLSQLL